MSEAGEAGQAGTEIDVTPEMVAVGVSELYRQLGYDIPPPEEAVAAVFKAMLLSWRIGATPPIERIAKGDPLVIKALWKALPSPVDVDLKDEQAARRMLRALVRAASAST